MGDYGPEFEAFWPDMLQRPGSCPKKLCYAYWTGRRPLVDGSRIEPRQWPEIHEGAKIRCELDDTEPEYRMNAGKWIYNGEWEGWLAKKQQMIEREANRSEEDRERARKHQALMEFHEWRVLQKRGPYDPKPTWAEFMASRLKVVG